MSRQAEILATAARLFNERGFHGVSVDEIGRQLGVTGPALYRHFKGKDEILATLFNDAMDRAAIDPSSFTDDPHEQLDLLIRHHARFVVEHRDLVAIYAHEHRALVDPWRTMFVRRMTEHGARWDAVIAACHPDADPLDVRTTTQAAIGLLHSVVTWPPALVDRPDIVERLRDQVLRGVGGGGGRPPPPPPPAEGARVHAAAFEAFGPPENLVPTERPDPAPRDGWTVVELDAAALNWHDCLVRQGQYGFVPLPHVPGADGSGRRRDTGEPVIVLPSLHWGGQERAPGPDWQILGDQEEGTYAELVSVPEANVLPRPAGWSAVEAAALPLAGLTAHRALFARGGLRRGETVLVPGAGGGVATFAIGLARMAGARVLVTSSSRAKIDRAKELGADDGVLYTDADWTAQVRELTGGVGVDLVFDSTGVWQDALDTLCRGGRVVTFGATSEATTTVDVRRFYFGQWSILGTTMGSPADFAGLLDLLGEEPTWRPVVDRVLPLDRAGEAHAVMERREHTGKIVLEIT